MEPGSKVSCYLRVGFLMAVGERIQHAKPVSAYF